jgi:hypothetical protein
MNNTMIHMIYRAAAGLWAGFRFLCMLVGVLLPADAAWAGGACAEVKVEIRQSMTLERQAFDAMMKINNGFEAIALSNVTIQVQFFDANKQPVTATTNPNNTNALFFYRVDSLQNIQATSNGTVAAKTTAELHWLIIPAQGAGGTNSAGQMYYVGATLQYRMRDQVQTVEVTPDYIMVRPMPKLTLDYFLPGPVYGDDPFTTTVEELIPFPLGLRIRNSGAGPAYKLKIESAQPQIMENRLGLLVGFNILGCEVQGADASRSLLADFGTLAPNQAKVARWAMTASLMGRFTNFTASYTHANELGGELTSLIQAVRTHELIKDVRVDLPDRDRIGDFLARTAGSLKVYESDNYDTPVADLSAGAVLQSAGTTNGIATWLLDVAATNQTFYVKKSFTDGSRLDLVAAVRADGKALDPANVWLAKTRAAGTDPWSHWLQVFDAEGGGRYTLTFRARPVPDNQPPVLAFIGSKATREGEALGFLVEASDPDATVPDLTARPLPAGATLTPHGDGTATFAWTPANGQYGVHPVRFTADDGQYRDWEMVRIYVGRPGEELCNGLPCSLKDWNVQIKEIWPEPTNGSATVVWDAAEGLLYDLFYSDNPFGPGGGWSKLGATREGAGVEDAIDDVALDSQRMRRFYKLVLAGDTPDTNQVWGVIRRDVNPGFTLISPPVRTDRRFDGEMGAALAETLQGHDGGIGSGADEVYVLQANGSWRTLYVDASGTWREANGAASAYEIPAGQGLWVARRTPASARITFTGPVGNDGTRTNRLVSGWNLIGLSEGKDLPLKATFAAAQPVGAAVEENADQIVIQKPDGSWRRLIYVQGWGAPYDGNWFDLSSFQVVPTNEVLQPGQAYYYLRRGAATDVKF